LGGLLKGVFVSIWAIRIILDLPNCHLELTSIIIEIGKQSLKVWWFNKSLMKVGQELSSLLSLKSVGIESSKAEGNGELLAVVVVVVDVLMDTVNVVMLSSLSVVAVLVPEEDLSEALALVDCFASPEVFALELELDCFPELELVSSSFSARRFRSQPWSGTCACIDWRAVGIGASTTGTEGDAVARAVGLICME
jgi:hypothetical protein